MGKGSKKRMGDDGIHTDLFIARTGFALSKGESKGNLATNGSSVNRRTSPKWAGVLPFYIEFPGIFLSFSNLFLLVFLLEGKRELHPWYFAFV